MQSASFAVASTFRLPQYTRNFLDLRSAATPSEDQLDLGSVLQLSLLPSAG